MLLLFPCCTATSNNSEALRRSAKNAHNRIVAGGGAFDQLSAVRVRHALFRRPRGCCRARHRLVRALDREAGVGGGGRPERSAGPAARTIGRESRSTRRILTWSSHRSGRSIKPRKAGWPTRAARGCGSVVATPDNPDDWLAPCRMSDDASARIAIAVVADRNPTVIIRRG